MTDRDPDAGLRLLRDSLYGGPPLPPAPLAASLRRLRLRLPCLVVAVQYEGARAPAPPRALVARVRRLHLHAGLAYWCAMVADPAPLLAHLDALGALHGGVQPCAAPERLQTAIREAVVDLRRRELSGRRGGTAPAPSAASEAQLRGLLVHQIAADDPAWRANLRVWTELAVVRHQRSLNNLRRRMVEVLALISREHDERDLGFCFARAIERIYACFTYSGLERLFPSAVEELVERLQRPVVGDLRRARSPAVRAAAACVRERFAEPISLAEVADAAGVGAAHLARRWRREVGCSVGDSLRALRLAEARRLLAGRPQTVLAIALRCGFNSVEHFHRTFRAALGTSPAAWRRRALAEGEGEEER